VWLTQGINWISSAETKMGQHHYVAMFLMDYGKYFMYHQKYKEADNFFKKAHEIQ
jgi:uncharacterized protein HemY